MNVCYFDTIHSGMYLIKIIRNNVQSYFGEIFAMLISRKCLLSFGAESFVFQAAIQKLKD